MGADEKGGAGADTQQVKHPIRHTGRTTHRQGAVPTCGPGVSPPCRAARRGGVKVDQRQYNGNKGTTSKRGTGNGRGSGQTAGSTQRTRHKTDTRTYDWTCSCCACKRSNSMARILCEVWTHASRHACTPRVVVTAHQFHLPGRARRVKDSTTAPQQQTQTTKQTTKATITTRRNTNEHHTHKTRTQEHKANTKSQ